MPEWSIGPHSKCGVRATVPGVRIPPFPLQNATRFLVAFFCVKGGIRSACSASADLSSLFSECAVLLRNIRFLIKNHLLKQVWHLLFNYSPKPSVLLHILLQLLGLLSAAAAVRIPVAAGLCRVIKKTR